MSRCRIHGPTCTTLWGWDRAHTDSDQPYTLDELITRQECPHLFAYPTPEEYEQGWYLWRALRRDGRPNAGESDAAFAVLVEHLNARHGLTLTV